VRESGRLSGMKRIYIASLAASALALSACSFSDAEAEEDGAPKQAASAENSSTDEKIGENFNDKEGYDDEQEASKPEATSKDGKLSVSLPEGVTQQMLGERTTQKIALQVMLDQSRHSPGVIDGLGGGNTDRAVRYYRMANDMGDSTKVDDELMNALYSDVGGDIFRTYTITQKDVSRPFEQTPDGFEAMSKVDKLGYQTPLEMLAERFHMDQDFLAALNPDADFGKVGTKLTIVSHGNRSFDSEIARIEVRKGEATVVGLDDAGKVLVSYPATIGSSRFPSPSGKMEVSALAMAPNYTFDPDSQKWGPDKTFILPPGPNNPVGGTWIDLGKDGYGIHGSPDPQLIAKTASHGCVRLTNWDVAELANAVNTGIPVEFV